MDQIYDVAVIGGGPSGIAAAYYAAKGGSKTVLLEKDSVIGGTAYRANVNTLNGESLSRMDGLLDGITKKAWGHIIFDPEELLDRYYRLLEDSKAYVLSGCEVISAESTDGRISRLVCSSASGRITISANIIIDASGLSVVDNLMGIKDGSAYSYSYVTALIGKVETVGGKCYSQQAQKLLGESISAAKDSGRLDRELFIKIRPTVRADIAHVTVKYNGDNATGIDMRRHLNTAMDFLRDFGYGFENASVISSSKEIFAGVNASFNAKYAITLTDISENKYFSDQVAAIPDGDDIGDPMYYIPYGALQSKSYDNLLLCGRNIGAAANALQRIDSVATHFETGKAAGIAAAIAIKNNLELSKVSTYEIVSKSEDSIGDKIEIMNEALKMQKKEQISGSLQDQMISELSSAKTSVVPRMPESDIEPAESFKELEQVLGLLGDDTPPPSDTYAAHEVSQFADIMDIELPDEAAPEYTPEPKHVAKNELESLFDALNDFSEIAREDDHPDISDEPGTEKELTAKDSLSSEPPESPDLEKPAEAVSAEELLFGDVLNGAYIDKDDASTTADMPKTPQEDAADAPHDIDENPSEPADVAADTAPSWEDELYSAYMDASENKEDKEIQPEPKTPQNTIISSSDVLDMLYDEPADSESEAPAVSGFDAGMIRDDLSVLYDDDTPAEKPASNAETAAEPAREDNTQHKMQSAQAPQPKTKSVHRNEMDSILDMIYEITDSKEQNSEPDLELEHEIPPPGQRGRKTLNGRISGKIENYDKFKAIKDFLYDED